MEAGGRSAGKDSMGRTEMRYSAPQALPSPPPCPLEPASLHRPVSIGAQWSKLFLGPLGGLCSIPAWALSGAPSQSASPLLPHLVPNPGRCRCPGLLLEPGLWHLCRAGNCIAACSKLVSGCSGGVSDLVPGTIFLPHSKGYRHSPGP